MKRVTQLMLLLMLAAGVTLAGTVDVNFASLTGPMNIVPAPHSIDNLRFSYAGADGAYLCAFDAGASGVQLGIGGGNLPCVGAQVDSSGVYGLTDGALVLDFVVPAFFLQFNFGLFNYDGLAAVDDFGVQAAFFLGGTPIDFATEAGSVPDFGFSAGSFLYGGGALFDQAVINFYPTIAIANDDLGIPGGSFGQTTFQMDTLSYGEIPEPSSFILFTSALLLIGAGTFRKRKR